MNAPNKRLERTKSVISGVLEKNINHLFACLMNWGYYLQVQTQGISIYSANKHINSYGFLIWKFRLKRVTLYNWTHEFQFLTRVSLVCSRQFFMIIAYSAALAEYKSVYFIFNVWLYDWPIVSSVQNIHNNQQFHHFLQTIDRLN